MPGEVRRVTLLDLRLGLVTLSSEQLAAMRERVLPILAGAAERLYREQCEGRGPGGGPGHGQDHGLGHGQVRAQEHLPEPGQ